ncbi:hypothetical protein IKG73_02520 [Candidatus Saccharibacteria bacterium]|nr:hypothetical protein [Candidatus Saccharibacteria bacterium]
MVIGIVMILLFAAFFVVRKHIGPGILAVIAGVAVDAAFSPMLVDFFHSINFGLPDGKLKALISLVLIVGFPMILYFKSSRGGMFGILRIAEALVMAALITALLAPAISEWFAFDDLSRNILAWINSVRGIIMMSGIGLAYLDILFYRG